jgi:EAL domain-containing protein (putative c-di-GMP-specific phosphodiesterase class I)
MPEAAAGTDQAAWYLEELADGGSIRRIPIQWLPFKVGRKHDLALCLTSNTVSKEHAEIADDGGKLVIRDLGSTNGTFVNGQRITEAVALRPGDRIHIANLEFRLACGTPLAVTATMQEAPGLWIWAACQFDRVFDEGASVPYFQPIKSLPDAKVFGYEVLARSLVEGLQGPREMFLIAAHLHQEGELSRHFRDLGVQKGCQLPGRSNLFLNTHPAELNSEDLLPSLQKLRESEPRHPITLEIHEAAVTDLAAMRELRAALRDLDIGLAYDDFGSGQDRLLDLAEVSPDFLKFDSRFVRNLDSAAEARQNLVQTLVAMVRGMGIAPLAEGIETSAENETCIQLGFQFAQGYFHGRPAPLADWQAAN